MMNKNLAEVRSHAELVVADVLRSSASIYENELASSGTDRDICNTGCDMDSIGDQTLIIERNVTGGDDKPKETGKQEKEPKESNMPENTETGDCAVALKLIEKIKADTAKLNDTLKLFNRKHKTLPSIAESRGEEG